MVQQEITTKHGWSSDPALPIFNAHQGWEPLTMNYRQTATNEQTTLFTAKQTTKPKSASVPVYKVTLVREGRVSCYQQQIRSSADASMLLHTYLAHVDREHFVIILLNQKNRVIGVSTISIGSLTASIVHPREVYKSAILSNAASIICGHNHPSTDCQPSKEDRAITARLVEAGRLLGVNVLDHVIISGTGKHFSFADANLL
jgi:DNA repair protein RadC